DKRRLRRDGRPHQHAAALRQADPGPHGPGQRQGVDRHHHAAAHRPVRPPWCGGLRHPQVAARPGAARVRDLPEQAGRRHQDPAPAL
ncbi:MAG: Threonine dehydrogenase and related Zn-dependent dehydrogenases, partial [uncultured Rubrobacteraceae bacterium]